MAPRTTRSSNKKSKKGNSVEEEDRIEVEIAPLSGILVTLPYETLVEILSLCTPQSLVRMLRTCKAIKGLVDAEERTLYRKLYHNLLSKNSRVSHHYLYSPMKQTAAIEYLIVNYLPAKSIYSWKDQFKFTFLWDSTPHYECCMKCFKTPRICELELIDEFKLRLCAICFASVLVLPSNISLYQVTTKDLVGVPTVELKTEGMLGFRQAKFYCSVHLEALGLQKHGDKYTGPKIIELDEADKSQLREDTISTACLLHAGVSYRISLYGIGSNCGSANVATTLQVELTHAANGKSFKKTSGLKKRDLGSILQDYVRLVKNFISTVPIADQGDPIPFFLPARNPGPLIPSDSFVSAYGRIRREFSSSIAIGNYESPRTANKIAALQTYVLSPTDSNWQTLKQIIRESRIQTGNTMLVNQLNSGNQKSWLNMQEILNQLENQTEKKLSKDQLDRVNLLAQCDTIIGTDGLTSYNVGRLLSSGEDVAIEKSWRQMFYEENCMSSFLQHIYTVSKAEWQGGLNRYLSKLNANTDMTSTIALQLLPSYPEGNNQRVNKKLRNRDSVPREKYEEQIKEAMVLVKSGILSSSSVIAYLHKRSRCICIRQFIARSRCTGDCWIRLVEFDYNDDF